MGIWSIDKNQKEQKMLWKGTKCKKKKKSNSQHKALKERTVFNN